MIQLSVVVHLLDLLQDLLGSWLEIGLDVFLLPSLTCVFIRVVRPA